MPSAAPDIVFAGIGAACGLGYGKASLIGGLLEGRDVFGPLTRPGRAAPEGAAPFLGVEMADPPPILPPRLARTAGFATAVAVAVVDEAWREAALDSVAPERIGLVVGGSNLFAREQALMARDYAARPNLVPPRAGHVYLDSEMCGLLTSVFAIRGFAFSVGAASASGTSPSTSASWASRACAAAGRWRWPVVSPIAQAKGMCTSGELAVLRKKKFPPAWPLRLIPVTSCGFRSAFSKFPGALRLPIEVYQLEKLISCPILPSSIVHSPLVP